VRTTSLAKAIRDYRIHWHVLLVHFPISMFGTGFMFQTLHLIFAPDAFTLASAVVVTAGTVTMIPTVISGWMSWRHSYKGARTKVFTRKIIIAFTMLGVSVALTAWRLTFSSLFDEKLSPAHWLFMAGTVLLITGAVAEGYFGGKLRHST
jgi:uncharacterized membrane protein